MRHLKEDFPIFAYKQEKKEPYVYLDSAATTHKPQVVIDAITRFYSQEYATVHRNLYRSSREVTEAYSAVRGKVCRWIHAEHDHEIVFTRGTTAALNLLAISMNDSLIPAGGCVLVSEVEHHANVLSWELACRRRGSHVKKISVDPCGYLNLEHLETLLREGASVVSIAHVNSVTGAIQPLSAIARLVHHYGACLVVDGAQSVAHLPIHVVDDDVDFYVFSAHKIYGPTGVGVLYGKSSLLERLPPVEGGGDMVVVYDPVAPQYQTSPLKFEAGTPPIAAILGLGAALEYLQALPMSVYQQQEDHLTGFLYEQLMTIPGIQVLGPGYGQPRGALVSFKIPNVHAFDLGCLLDVRGISVRTGHQCSQPSMQRWGVGHVVRASLGIYNSQSDVHECIHAIHEVCKQITKYA